MNLIGRKHTSICGMRHVFQLVLNMRCLLHVGEGPCFASYRTVP
jgi:hypothetical protein